MHVVGGEPLSASGSLVGNYLRPTYWCINVHDVLSQGLRAHVHNMAHMYMSFPVFATLLELFTSSWIRSTHSRHVTALSKGQSPQRITEERRVLSLQPCEEEFAGAET